MVTGGERASTFQKYEPRIVVKRFQTYTLVTVSWRSPGWYGQRISLILVFGPERREGGDGEDWSRRAAVSVHEAAVTV